MKAARWFDAGSLAALERGGWPRLSTAQSALFAHLDEGGTPPAELARRLGRTRQATQELVAGLCRHGLLALEEDPRRRGGRLVRLTDDGRRLVRDAYATLMAMEAALGNRSTARLRTLLVELLHLQDDVDRRQSATAPTARA